MRIRIRRGPRALIPMVLAAWALCLDRAPGGVPDTGEPAQPLATTMTTNSFPGPGLGGDAAAGASPTAAADSVAPDSAVTRLTPLLPPKASARASKPRRLLIFCPAPGKSHAAVGAYGAVAIRLMGEAHHIFASTITDDPEVLEPARLGQFDAAVLNNTLGECFGEGPAVARHARALVEFVQDGKGLVGIHGAAVVPNFQNPPTDEIESQYRLMLGAAFEKPASLEVSPELRVEDPLNPVCAVFDGMERYPLPFKDEILQLKAPYSRDHLRVLLSADMSKLEHRGTRADSDYPVVWLKGFDQGRVFFFALGHSPDTFNDRVLLQLLQDGIQYALGDLPANDLPR